MTKETSKKINGNEVSKSETENFDSIFPDMENAPDIVKKMVFSSISSNTSNPFFEKINEEHINTLLNSVENESKRDFDNANRNRYFIGGLLALILIFIIAISLIFTDKDFIKDVLTILITFIGGLSFGGGLGYAIGNKNK